MFFYSFNSFYLMRSYNVTFLKDIFLCAFLFLCCFHLCYIFVLSRLVLRCTVGVQGLKIRLQILVIYIKFVWYAVQRYTKFKFSPTFGPKLSHFRIIYNFIPKSYPIVLIWYKKWVFNPVLKKYLLLKPFFLGTIFIKFLKIIWF